LRDNQIGELLRICRERAGLNQRELAELLHLDRTTVTKIETGALPHPSYSLVKQWAAITKSEELIGMDLTGSRDGWKKLQQLESQVSKIRELVNFMVRRKKVNANS